MSQNLGTVQPNYNVFKYWDTWKPGTNGKLMVLGVPIFKHWRVLNLLRLPLIQNDKGMASIGIINVSSHSNLCCISRNMRHHTKCSNFFQRTWQMLVHWNKQVWLLFLHSVVWFHWKIHCSAEKIIKISIYSALYIMMSYYDIQNGIDTSKSENRYKLHTRMWISKPETVQTA